MAADRMRIAASMMSAIALAVQASTVAAADPDGPDRLFVLGHGPDARPVRSIVGELLDRFEPDPGEPQSPEPVPGQGRGLLQGAGLPSSSTLVPSSRDAGIRPVDIPLTSPLCLVGPDRASLTWITSNRLLLARAGASCILVRAASREQLDLIRRHAHPVPVHSVPIDDLAASFGIRTVPVLLVGQGAMDQ